MKFFKEIKLKPLDIALIIGLFVASFSVLMFLPGRKAGATAQVRVNGNVVKTFDLSENQVWTYHASGGYYNEIEVKNDAIAVVKENCHYQIAVDRGYVSKVGDTVVCLPLNLVVEVMSGQKNSEVDYSE